MSKFTGILFLALVGGLAFSIEKLFELSGQNRDLSITNERQAGQIKSLQGDLQKVHKQEQTEYLAQQTTVESLKARLKQQQDALALAADRLRIDRNQGPGGREVPALQDKLNEQKSLVQDLENSLKGVQAQEKLLDQQGRQTQQDYGQNQRQTDADAKSEIDAQQAVLKSMQDQAKDLYRNRNDYNTGLQLKDLQTKIGQQKQAVDQLKAQRAQAAQEYNSAKIGSSTQNQQQKQELKRSEQDIQSRLSAERAKLNQLQKDIQGGVSSKKAFQDELKNAEADYNAKKAAVSETETQLQSETAKLSAIAN